jgi:Mrp family chromosome partitioning ATPase/capsular polysaccharide biosynthesis protein
MDVVAYLRILRRHWRMIALAVLIGGLLGAGTSVVQKTTSSATGGRFYKATHTLFLDGSQYSNYRPVFNNVDQMAVLATTGDVPQRVADTIGGEPKDLVTHIFISTNSTLSTIDITGTDRDSKQAALLADTFASELVDSIKDKEQARRDQTRDETLKRLNELRDQIATLDAQLAARPPDLSLITAQRNSLVNNYSQVFERFQGLANAPDQGNNLSTLQNAESEPIAKTEYNARITAGQLGNNRVRADSFQSGTATGTNSLGQPTSSTSSSTRFDGPVARGLLGALLGLLVGVGLALVADRIDRRVRVREEFEGAYGMPVLAEIPTLKVSEQRSFEVVARATPFSRAAEAYRAVRSSLLFQRPLPPGGQPNGKALTVMVASAGPKEGKSTTSANLACVFAEGGQRVMVMNCDFRRPTLHRFFGVENEPRRVLESGVERLMLVSDVTGPENPNPAHVTEQQRRIIQNSQEHFDVVVLDTAPLLSTNDATELMDLVDLVIVVGRVGHSTADSALRVRELLSRIDAPVAGVVMVGVDAPSNDYYYYYSRGRAKAAAPQMGRRQQKAEAKKVKSSGGNGNGSARGDVVRPEVAEG